MSTDGDWPGDAGAARELAGWLAGLLGGSDPPALLGGLMHMSGARAGVLLFWDGIRFREAAARGIEPTDAEEIRHKLTDQFVRRVSDSRAPPRVLRDERGGLRAMPLVLRQELVGAVWLEGSQAMRAAGPLAAPLAGALAAARQLAGVGPGEDLVAAGPRTQEVVRTLTALASSPHPVLIEGESGTGKELAARFLHRHGPKRDGPFVAANCAAIPESLQESELFGHVGGAFTGAKHDRPGLLAQANEGTLFLDEVEAMRPSMQETLLRAIETGEVRALGASASRRVKVRILSASNEPLAELVSEGRFRDDLFYRLAVLRVRMPSLRERPEEIPVLAETLLERMGMEGTTLADDARRTLMTHAWPGNVRELENALKRAATMGGARELTAADFAFLRDEPWARDPADRLRPLREYVRQMSSRYGRLLGKAELAQRLGISRKTLWKITRSERKPKNERRTENGERGTRKGIRRRGDRR